VLNRSKFLQYVPMNDEMLIRITINNLDFIIDIRLCSLYDAKRCAL
jgi:hypothetical protein